MKGCKPQVNCEWCNLSTVARSYSVDHSFTEVVDMKAFIIACALACLIATVQNVQFGNSE